MIDYLLKVNDFIATIDTVSRHVTSKHLNCKLFLYYLQLRFPLEIASNVGNVNILKLLLDALGGPVRMHYKSHDNIVRIETQTLSFSNQEKALQEATENEHKGIIDIIHSYNKKVIAFKLC